MSLRPRPERHKCDCTHDEQSQSGTGSSGHAGAERPERYHRGRLMHYQPETNALRPAQVAAALIGVDPAWLRKALKFVGHEGKVTLDQARAAMRAWHDRPVMPVRRVRR